MSAGKTIMKRFAVNSIRSRIIMLVLGIALLLALGDILGAIFSLGYAAQAVTLVLAIAASLTCAALLSRSISARLSALKEVAAGLSRGDLKHRVAISGDDELARLAASFNKMADSISWGAEKAAREHDRVRSIHQAITDGLVVYDADGRIASVNPAAEAALGLLESDLLGKQVIGLQELDQIICEPHLVPEEQMVRCWLEKNCAHLECPSYESSDLQCWLQCGTCCHDEIQGTFSQKRNACERCDVYQRNGIHTCDFHHEDKDYSLWVSPILTDSGREEGRLAVIRDVTQAKAVQRDLQIRNNELLVINEVGSALTRSLDDSDVFFKDVLTRIVTALGVRGAVIMLREEKTGHMLLKASTGIEPHTALFFELLDFDEELDLAEDAWAELVDTESLMRRHRSVAPTLAKEKLKKPLIVPLWTKGNIVGVMMLFDDTKEDYAEAALRLINALASQIAVAAQNVSLFSNVARAKRAWETTFDAMADGISVHDLDRNIMRANRAMGKMFGTSIEELVGRKCFETIHCRTSPIALCPQQEVVKTGKSVSIEVEESHLGKTFRLSVNPVKDNAGNVIGLVHVLRDITERKQLREQLLQSEKMAAVGQLVSGVAHELNNPLTGVIGYSQLLLRRCEDEGLDAVTRDLNAIFGEAQRASRIVQNLLSFARKHQPQKNLVDLNDAVRTVLDLRAYELNVSNIEVLTDLGADLPNVLADFHQIEQVLLNVINNAGQAIEAAGRPGVINVRTQLRDGAVAIAVADNGAGIPAEHIHRIFDPFFTTKAVGKGTGLGLSICYGIIEEHGGEIKVESKPGEGATFTIELPLTGETEALIVDNPVSESGAPGQKRVLLVDDEPAIVDLLTDILTMAGHGVDVASNGSMALKKLASANYDNVITDIRMPEMDGRELHQRIREIDPRLAANVIFITGDTAGGDTLEYLDQTGNMYLVKPFDLHELRANLERVLKKND